MKNKVCQVTCVHDRYDTRIFHKIAKSLNSGGFDSYILCVDDRGEECRDGVHFISVQYKPKNRINRILKSWKKLVKIALEIDADIYQLHDPELLPLGKFLAKKNKIIIFDSHEDGRDIGMKGWIPKPFRKLVCRMYLLYEKNAIKKLAGCISVDSNIVQRLSNYNGNCIQITNFPFLPSQFNHNPNGYICYAGSPESYAQYEFLSALEVSGIPINYYLITNTSDKTLDRCKKLEIWKDIKTSNYVSFEELSKIYMNASLGMSIAYPDIGTDYWNGVFGVTKFFEFLAYGIPVICSSFDVWKKIIEKYDCGICVNPYKIDEISSALATLFSNRIRLMRMGENARRAAEKEFNWSTQETKLICFYKMLLEQRS